jgi:NAD(P)-dependent dehydrogenase (short-subunit alcohol dehydrogenase family)
VLGIANAARGKINSARREIRRSLLLEPNQGLVLHQLGKLHTHTSNHKIAKNNFRWSVALNPMSPEIRLDLADVVPAMVERGSGHIAVVSSVAGYRGLPTAAAYGATKAALNNMTEALKFDLEQKGIKVQLVCPGFVRTPLTDKNPYPMPFLMEPDAAAEAFYRGLQGSVFEINFPRTFTTIMKQLRKLPHGLYMAAMRRGAPSFE